MVSEGAVPADGLGNAAAAELLYLCLEVAGCPTVCRHCWAQGVRYGAMPLSDIEWVLDGAHAFCDSRDLAFDAYPMHELAAHPDAARLLQETLDEEAATDKKLTQIAEQRVNPQAAAV